MRITSSPSAAALSRAALPREVRDEGLGALPPRRDPDRVVGADLAEGGAVILMAIKPPTLRHPETAGRGSCRPAPRRTVSSQTSHSQTMEAPAGSCKGVSRRRTCARDWGITPGHVIWRPKNIPWNVLYSEFVQRIFPGSQKQFMGSESRGREADVGRRPGRVRLGSEKGVRLAQKMQACPCIPVDIQLQKAQAGPTSGPTWRLPHLPL